MKCARCGHDSTYPQRTGQTCPGCHERFAFEPRTGDALSDMAWKSAIDWCSSNGTVRFTKANLHHAIARRMAAKVAPVAGIVLSVLAITAILVFAATGHPVPGVFALAMGLGAIGAIVGHGRRGLTLEVDDFNRMYATWVGAHGVPAKLIEPIAAPRALTAAMSEELESYSFDRAVICDRPETADLLLGNDFHFENNCAVITADGYPGHAFPTVRRMLQMNPRLEVFVLHDASVAGCTLAHDLRHQRDWFGGSTVRVYDVALRPAQAAAQKKLLWHTPARVDEHPALTTYERRWLQAHRMNLASLAPEQTIKRLFRAINKMPELAAATAAATTDDTVILWTTDAHASDGGGDSFG